VRIITRTDTSVEPKNWRQILSSSIRDLNELLQRLNLSPEDLPAQQRAALDFPILVPEPFLQQMTIGNPNDPLLLQVLPRAAETEIVAGYITDPLAEKHANVNRGIIHKYHGRVLLLAASGCAVNCRYCFRRHFAYEDNRISREDWKKTLDYVQQNNSITEVILSGGDPLMLRDSALFELITEIENIPHVKRLRIHSRLPVVIPQRLTAELIQHLGDSQLGISMVMHINHPNELSELHRERFKELRRAGVLILNQAVLLRNINDKLKILSNLSELLFEFGVLPYYLHLLDPVKGAHHFDVPEHEAQQLYQQLLARLPGYLVPKLVRELAGEAHKSPIGPP
jgi:EF-P beta-lysylation protein EpmB